MAIQAFLAGALAVGLALSADAATGEAGAVEALLDSGTVSVEQASAAPAKRGDTVYIHFVIANESEERIHLSSLRTEVADEARLMARVNAHQARDIGSIGVDSEETLDLTGSQLWYEAGPLRRDLNAGDTFTVVLDFVTWRLTVPVQVFNLPSP